jgi:nicotinamidase/pyrazinamidase
MSAQAKIEPGDTSILIVVDVQNSFLPGGSLAVTRGDDIIPVINRMAVSFRHVVLTQDWHPANHLSFASQHQGKRPFDTVQLPYGNQVLWPDHCVQETEGAALSKDLAIPHAALIIRKGFRRTIDSYSAFVEADGKTQTGLGGYLRQRGLSEVFVCGLATDFCVCYTALDARKQGFTVSVVEDAARGIDANNSLQIAWDNMKKMGVKRIASADIAA